MYDICDYFRLNREVVGIALFYVDRYFTITFQGGDERVPVTRRKFQLVALTGLFVAVKLHGESRQDPDGQRSPFGSPNPMDASDGTSIGDCQAWNRVKFSLTVCASISRNQFDPSEIEECERALLFTLDWHVNPVVSSGSIIDSLLVYLPGSNLLSAANIPRPSNVATYDRSESVSSEPPSMARATTHSVGGATIVIEDGLSLYVYDCAKYLCELSVSIPALSLVYKPSVVAYASIIYALDSLHRSSSVKSDDPSSLSIILPQQMSRWGFEARARSATTGHFESERENVVGAVCILRAICPNLGDLFHLPTLAVPTSPTSVVMQS